MAIDPGEIGQRLRKARERRGWTQFQFATEAHVSISSVQRWEKGKLPPVRELTRLADLLGIPTDLLVEEREEDRPLGEIQRQLEVEVDRLSRLNDQLEERLAPQAASRRARTQR